MTFWGDLAARARGLASRLLDSAHFRALARTRTVEEFGVLLADWHIVPTGNEPLSASLLERHVGHRYASALEVLAAWAGEERSTLLAPLLEEDTCRALRSLVRAAFGRRAATGPGDVLVLPMELSALPLATLGTPPTLGELADFLRESGSPYAAPLVAQAERHQPDLLELETALYRLWATRAAKVARRAGPAMTTYVSRYIDWHNAETALLLAGRSEDLEHATLFIGGGATIGKEIFLAAARASSVEQARALLRVMLRRTSLLQPLMVKKGRTEALLRVLQREQQSIARLDPLGVGTIVWLVLSLRLEVLQLQRLLWGIAMGAPEQRLMVSHLDRK